MVLSAQWGSNYFAEALDLGKSASQNDYDDFEAAQIGSDEQELVIHTDPTAGRKTDYRPLIGEEVGPKGALQVVRSTRMGIVGPKKESSAYRQTNDPNRPAN